MRNSDADIAIDVLNKLIDQELEAVRAATRDGNTPFGGYARPDTTPSSTPGTRSGRRSPQPWMKGVRGIRSCRSVTSWSRRICTPAICAAGGARAPSIP